MASPFCLACGATIAEGTRFCVKCGQPVAAAPVDVATPPPPPPIPIAAAAAPVPPPLISPPTPPPVRIEKTGPGAGFWIGLFGLLLVLGGSGLWFYTTRMAKQPVAVSTASAPEVAPAPAVPVPTPTPVQPEPTPDLAPPPQVEIPVQKPPPPVKRPESAPPPQPSTIATPAAPVPDVRAPQRSGVLHATVEVAQNGEVVFENLPGARLRFTFDREAWRPTISRQPNGTQTLIMRSLKPGLQTSCDVRWDIVE